jgi:hypothetical protein
MLVLVRIRVVIFYCFPHFVLWVFLFLGLFWGLELKFNLLSLRPYVSPLLPHHYPHTHSLYTHHDRETTIQTNRQTERNRIKIRLIGSGNEEHQTIETLINEEAPTFFEIL